jgi:hypothetical protein
VNSLQISKKIPNVPIIFIKSNLQQSLRREWMLHGHERYLTRKNNNNLTISRLEHYQAFKDPSWPDITEIDMLDNLPPCILTEINKDFNKTNYPDTIRKDTVACLTQDYVNKIESAAETIIWHNDYYKNYPENFSNATEIIDIDTSNTEFSVLVRKELSLYKSELFDNVWKTIND